jgi:hypothetical protein
MELGRYKGFYQFNNLKLRKASGFDKTYFIIQVTDFDGHKFKGWVEDDTATGGMEGRGTVTGAIYSDGIMFVKEMPFMSIYYRDSANGGYQTKVYRNRKHMPIYYDGVEAENDQYKGTWNFKYGILTAILLFLLGTKPGGTWEMAPVKE